MTGVVQAAAGAAASGGDGTLRGGVVHQGGGFYRPTTLTPTSVTWKGVLITSSDFNTIGNNVAFRVTIIGAVLSQNFFTTITVKGTSGFRRLASSAATFSTIGGNSQWDWTVAAGNAPVWTAEDPNCFIQFS